jgi:DNA-binding transcriptional ArsR family regulator
VLAEALGKVDACAMVEPTDDGPLVLTSLAQFKALGHPLRHRLLNVLRQRPATLAQLAAALGSTKGTLAYHVKVMVDAGLLRQAGVRTVRGGTEQYFEPVSRTIQHGQDDPRAAEFLISAAVAEMLPARPGQPEATLLRHFRLDPAQARNLQARLDELHEAAVTEAPDGESYGLLLSLYRADIPSLPPDEPAEVD